MFHHQIVIISIYYLFSVCNCKIIKFIMYHSLVIFSHNIVKIRSNVLSEPIHKLQLSYFISDKPVSGHCLLAFSQMFYV